MSYQLNYYFQKILQKFCPNQAFLNYQNHYGVEFLNVKETPDSLQIDLQKRDVLSFNTNLELLFLLIEKFQETTGFDIDFVRSNQTIYHFLMDSENGYDHNLLVHDLLTLFYCFCTDKKHLALTIKPITSFALLKYRTKQQMRKIWNDYQKLEFDETKTHLQTNDIIARDCVVTQIINPPLKVIYFQENNPENLIEIQVGNPIKAFYKIMNGSCIVQFKNHQIKKQSYYQEMQKYYDKSYKNKNVEKKTTILDFYSENLKWENTFLKSFKKRKQLNKKMEQWIKQEQAWYINQQLQKLQNGKQNNTREIANEQKKNKKN